MQSTPHKILFICSGNTCRSPLAVAAWQAFAPPGLNTAQLRPQQPQPPIEVSSAGLSATEGAPASAHALSSAAAWGADLSAHRARPARAAIIHDADLICAMTQEQIDAVCDRFGAEAEKVFLLGSFGLGTTDAVDNQIVTLLQRSGLTEGIQDSLEILDPFGGSIEAYQACAAQIRRAVLGLITALHAGRL